MRDFLYRNIIFLGMGLGIGFLVLMAWSSVSFLLSRVKADKLLHIQIISFQDIVLRFRSNFWYTFGFIIYVSFYIFIIAWFRVVNVYETHFFYAPPGQGLYLIYALFRIIFICYFAWMLYFIGKIILNFINHKYKPFNLNLLEEFILCFFIGAAVLQFVFVILGYTKLYYTLTAYIIAVPLVAFSYSDIVAFNGKLGMSITEQYKATTTLKKYIYSVLFSIFIISCAALLIIKGLYPTGDGDYVTHYFPYYKAVITTHSIWPNDVWYQYYYSRGAGLMYFCILLTDFEAPQLISFCFFIISALAGFSLIRSVSDNVLLPFAASIIYITSFIYLSTFQKHHIITTSFLVSMVWMTIKIDNFSDKSRKIWTILLALLIGNLIIYFPPAASVVLAFLCLMFFESILRRKKMIAKSYAFLLSMGIFSILVVFGINYLITGMAEITPFRFFWKFSNQAKLSEWVSPYLMILLDEGSSSSMGNFGFELRTISYLISIFSINEIFPIKSFVIIPLTGVFFLWLNGNRLTFNYWRIIFPILAILFCAVLISFVSAAHLASFIRFFIFTVFFTIMIVILLLNLSIILLQKENVKFKLTVFRNGKNAYVHVCISL